MNLDFQDYNARMHMAELRIKCFGENGSLSSCTFECDNGSVPQMTAARNYADHWEALEERGLGLLLWGEPGNGKTFAAAAIANALMDKHVSVRMTTFGGILNTLPSLSPEDKLRYLNELKTCGLLILDDFGMERKTDYAREQIFTVVDGRYLSGRPMVITTNLTLTQMKTTTDMADRRIFDRVLEKSVPLCFSGPSLRQKKAGENLKLYRELTGV